MLSKLKCSSVISWSHWYEVSQTTVNQFFIQASGLNCVFKPGEKRTFFEWMEVLQTHLSEEKLEPNFNAFSKDEGEGKKVFAELVIAAQHNLTALEQRNKTISDIVERVASSSPRAEDYILEAITIDPTVLSAPTVERFIQKAVLEQNNKFLSKISSALLKKSPRPRDPEYDHLRLMMSVIAELQGRDNPSLKALDETNDLLHLIKESDDTLEAMRHHIKTRRKDTRSS